MSRERMYWWPIVIGIGLLFICSNALWLVPFMRDIERGAERAQNEIARRVALQADFFLEQRLRELADLAVRVAESGDSPRVRRAVADEFLATHAGFISVEIAPMSLGEGEYSISPVVNADGKKTIAVTVALPRASFEMRAVVGLGDSIAALSRERVDATGYVYAIDRQGSLVYHPYEGTTRAGEVRAAGVEVRKNAVGIEVLSVAVEASGTGWVVVAESPLAEAWANKTFAVRLAGFLAVMGILFVIVLIVSFSKVMEIAVREAQLHKGKREYISVLAHQLRTPLAATKWNLKMLMDGDWGAVNRAQKKFLERSYETNEQMIALVRDLLDITRIEEGRYGFSFAQTDAGALVRNAVDGLREQAAAAGVTLKVAGARAKGKPLMISADAEKLGMALQNLIENGIRYNRARGSVTVSVAREGDKAAIAVRDTGVGIPKRDIQKLFTKFFRADNVVRLQVQGFGLGLYIVKNIIERHGGAISVQSAEGKGSVFTVRLPLA